MKQHISDRRDELSGILLLALGLLTMGTAGYTKRTAEYRTTA